MALQVHGAKRMRDMITCFSNFSQYYCVEMSLAPARLKAVSHRCNCNLPSNIVRKPNYDFLATLESHFVFTLSRIVRLLSGFFIPLLSCSATIHRSCQCKVYETSIQFYIPIVLHSCAVT